jgi:D-proline reductase (dithiol) PrdB
MPRLEVLSEDARQAILKFNFYEAPGVPWTIPPANLSEARLALVTTAGLHLRGDTNFTTGEATFRVIPGDVNTADLVQTQSSANFDRAAAQQDLNVVFPLERFREMVAAGRIGSLATNHYSLNGALTKWDRLLNETAPALAQRLLEDGVQVVFLTPT